MPTKRKPQDVQKVKELVQLLANATVTYYCCGGHRKAESNEMKIKEYMKKIRNLSGMIPRREELLEMGVFNGPGSA